MKILEAISDMNVGGAGVLLASRLACSSEYKKQTTVILPCGSALADKLRKEEINYIEMNACKNKSFSIPAILKYIGLINKISPDIVNCHGNLSFRIAAYFSRVPVRIYTRHCSFPAARWEKNSILVGIVGKMQSALSNGIIAVAYAAKDDLVRMRVREDKITVIVNGARKFNRYDAETVERIKKEAEIPLDTVIISIFARLEPCKDHLCFLKSAKLLIERGIKCYFLIVGCGSLESKLKKICTELGINGKIKFVGHTDNVEKYMNITDINVNCSVGTETASLALSEGMGLSIPCVVSDFGGNPYMVKDGKNGIIYPRGDSVALADSIEVLCNDYTLYEELSRGARKRFDEELNVNHMTEKTYEFYELMLRNYSKGKRFFGGHKCTFV